MKPIVTEKAVMKIERENMLTFLTSMKKTKEEIKRDIEEVFEIKVDKIRTQIRGNRKYVYAKLNKKYPAIDIATKLGLM